MDLKKPEEAKPEGTPEGEEVLEPEDEILDEGGDRRFLGTRFNRNLAASTASEEQMATKILLVDRGTCTFVTKVRNAERAGASLVVVIDNVYENITNVIMGDDGTGTGIRIPSMLIGKEDGKILRDFAKLKIEATLSAEFAVKALMDKVEMELWFSSNNQEALTFIKEFDEYAQKLQGFIDFHPRYVTWSCPNCDTTYQKEECFSDGKYCAPNHAKDAFNNVQGKQIIKENLRETCLHKRLVEKNKEALWWDYMKFAH